MTESGESGYRFGRVRNHTVQPFCPDARGEVIGP